MSYSGIYFDFNVMVFTFFKSRMIFEFKAVKHRNPRQKKCVI